MENQEKQNIEIENKNSEEINSNMKDKSELRNKRFPFIALIIILTIFVSSSFGAVFGFLASKNSGKIITGLKMEEQDEEADVIKQKIIQEDSAVIDVVKKSAPAVVSIVISKDIPKIQRFRGFPDFFDDPFGFYFGPGYDEGNNSGGTEKQKIGGGTGFFISEDGMIVTNRHVVDDSTADYTVVMDDEKEYPAKILAVDPVNDIAIIKIEGNNYPTLSLGNSSLAQIGQTVIAIGNSLGEFSNTVSRGIISGLGRNLTAGDMTGQSEKLNNIIQTDAAINPGNSGGPLLDINGQVIGINVAIAQGAQNVGFAIPVDQVKKIVDQVKTTGKISTPFIGVRYIPIDKEIQKENNLPYSYGVLVARGRGVAELAVVPGSPADKAGILENDIILEIEGKKVNDEKSGQSLTGLISQYNVGDTISLKIWQKGKEKEVKVTLEERK